MWGVCGWVDGWMEGVVWLKEFGLIRSCTIPLVVYEIGRGRRWDGMGYKEWGMRDEMVGDD
jgi:hypothetical protein